MTGLLLDTHAVLWWLTDDPALGSAARAGIADPEQQAFVSAATAWEIAIKRKLGKLQVPDDLMDTIPSRGFEWLTITPAHAWAAGGLPRHHQDPFDRMLIAQALLEDLPVATADSRFGRYGVDICW